jgi:hypothetical protein
MVMAKRRLIPSLDLSTPASRRANSEERTGKHAQPLAHECQPNVPIQPAMTCPISRYGVR